MLHWDSNLLCVSGGVLLSQKLQGNASGTQLYNTPVSEPALELESLQANFFLEPKVFK